MLYTLGRWYVEANKKLKKRSLMVKVSKSDFITLVMNSGIVKKKQRALYKNLERLEKDKFISYKNKSLVLTERGVDFFKKINKEINSYLKVHKTLNKKNIFKYSNKVQTKFL